MAEEVDRRGGPECRVCGLRIAEAPGGGPLVCVWCKAGRNRDGSLWTAEQFADFVHGGRVTPPTAFRG